MMEDPFFLTNIPVQSLSSSVSASEWDQGRTRGDSGTDLVFRPSGAALSFSFGGSITTQSPSMLPYISVHRRISHLHIRISPLYSRNHSPSFQNVTNFVLDANKRHLDHGLKRCSCPWSLYLNFCDNSSQHILVTLPLASRIGVSSTLCHPCFYCRRSRCLCSPRDDPLLYHPVSVYPCRG